ncbi:hypothetical protein Taro_040629, partial [Colocasia esculenta]|nr:hypothetical protein [Colocasia esculenta]
MDSQGHDIRASTQLRKRKLHSMSTLGFTHLIGPIVWARSTLEFSVCERDRGGHRVLNATALPVTFWKPPGIGDRLHVLRVSHARRLADVSLRKATPKTVAIRDEERAWDRREDDSGVEKISN